MPNQLRLVGMSRLVQNQVASYARKYKLKYKRFREEGKLGIHVVGAVAKFKTKKGYKKAPNGPHRGPFSLFPEKVK